MLARSIQKKLIKKWYDVMIFHNMNDFYLSENQDADLYIVDIGLPDGVWYDIIKHVRLKLSNNAPVIITSGYSEIEKKLYGFDIGADDYLPKPFEPDELIARIKSFMRRVGNKVVNSNINYGDFHYNPISKVLKKWNEVISLRKKEIDIVEYFLMNVDTFVTKEKLISKIWWDKPLGEVSFNNVNVTISKLRKQLWDDFKLTTTTGLWYRLEKIS